MKTTEAEFLKDVEKHALEIIRDDGVNRHIRLKQPGTSCMHFDLITWPGYLCYTGDMGTFVFRRLTDMFEFFRTDRNSPYMKSKGLTLGINLSYWAEKIEASNKSGRGNGIKEFDIDKAHDAVRDYFKTTIEELQPDEEDDAAEAANKAEKLASLTEALDDEIFRTSDEYEFVEAVRNFDSGDFEIVDFWEYTTDEYTHSFVWCCYALAWGIQKYDDAKDLTNPTGSTP